MSLANLRIVPLVTTVPSMHHLVKGTSIYLRQRRKFERSVGGIAKSNHCRRSADLPGYRECVGTPLGRRSPRARLADTQVGRGLEHHHGGLPQVVLINRQIALGLGFGQNEDNRSLRCCHVAGTYPDCRKLS